MHVGIDVWEDSPECDAVFYVMDVGAAADADGLSFKSCYVLVGSEQVLYEVLI